MNIFINETHIQIRPPHKDQPETDYDRVQNLAQEELELKETPEKLLLKEVSLSQMKSLLHQLIHKNNQAKRLISVLLNQELKDLKKHLKKDFKIIKAGGGLVRKGNQLLLIHRLGKWDLPKGKMDEGEKFRQTAVREVEEECKVEVKLIEKICTTWHHYQQNQDHVLKQTKWYLMDCKDDSNMRPQKAEDITDVQWMSLGQAKKATEDSYESIRFVLRQYEG